MSMYSLDLDKEDSYFPSHLSPIVILHDSTLPMHLEEVHSSPVTKKIPYERYLVIQEEDNPFSYNIEEIVHSLSIFPRRKSVRRGSEV